MKTKPGQRSCELGSEAPAAIARTLAGPPDLNACCSNSTSALPDGSNGSAQSLGGLLSQGSCTCGKTARLPEEHLNGALPFPASHA